MKKKLYILVLLIFVTTFSAAQTDWKTQLKLTKYDSVVYKRIYRIQVDDYQILELSELKNGEYDGTITNSVWKANRKGYRTELIIQKTKLPNLTVEKLMNNLKDNDFENIPDCQNVKDCIQGLDGTTITFSVLKNGTERNYSYWEPENEYYYKDNIIPEVIKVRAILKSVKTEFDLWVNFCKFRDSLPKGKYTYGIILLEKK